MKAPTHLWTMTPKIFLQVRPRVHKYLTEWKQQAAAIPDPELRKQALASIETKTFHCEGGSIYGLLAGDRYDEAIRFIVAYQTISDYLDNLCDRSTSLDPEDFRALHESMPHALTPGAACSEYYRLRKERDDGGYLTSLVKTCQSILEGLPTYGRIAPALLELSGYYCDLQVHKHVRAEERVPRLEAWFALHKDKLPPMSWYEFAACTGSTLGIFCLVSQSLNGECTDELVQRLKNAYFPWMQGLHILLDYLIDQEEDRAGRDLNFCSYYPADAVMAARLVHFYRRAHGELSRLPLAEFHRMMSAGLLAMYLADKKVYRQKRVQKIAWEMIRVGGGSAFFFYIVCWTYRRMRVSSLRSEVT